MTCETHQRCDLCAATGPVEVVPGYAVAICARCQRHNAHGWDSVHEPRLRAGLAKNGLLIPDRTDDGLWPFRYAPPSDFQL